MQTHVDSKINSLVEKQDVNRELIVQSNELLEKLEKTQAQSF